MKSLNHQVARWNHHIANHRIVERSSTPSLPVRGLRILLVRLRLLGDVVLTTPLIGAVRQAFPDAHLAYLVEPAAAAVVNGNRHLDEVILAPKRKGLARWAGDFRLARRLRRARYDIVIDLHGGPRAAWLAWATGAPRRIGYTIKGRTWMYTDVVRRAPDLEPRHSVVNQWDLLAPLGIAPPDPAVWPIEIAEDPGAVESVSRKLRALGIGPDEQLIMVHVSAGNPFRRWPAASFVELAERLARPDARRRIVMTSGPSEADAAGRIVSAARERLGERGNQVVDPPLDVAELRVLAGRAAVYIGGDSGPLHVASSTATPVVAIFGPTLPERSLPWRDRRWFVEAVDAGPLACRPCSQRVCVTNDFRCLTNISADQVIAAAECALRHHRVDLSRRSAGAKADTARGET
jgi:lipopolysaccharide heptosyltransferase II